MALPLDNIDQTDIKILDHKFSQIRRENGFIIIPDKYIELFIGEFSDNYGNLNKIKATQKNWNKVQAIYVSAFWLSNWYVDGLPTPKTIFTDIEQALLLNINPMPFVRLDSLSSKTKQPFNSMLEAIDDINKSDRCQKSLEITKLAGELPAIALREFKDLSKGKEYRCVIFEDKLRKIVPNDAKIGNISKEKLKERSQKLLGKVLNNLPCTDCVMDIWISDDNNDNSDLVIEFNSFGTIGNSYSDDIDWFDAKLYLDNIFDIEIKL